MSRQQTTMTLPEIVSPAEWKAAHDALLAKEEATRGRDALEAERRRLPMVRIDKDYLFDWPNGKARLVDLTTEQGENFGLSVFLREGEDVFRTYFTDRRGVEALGSVWTFLDLTPLGRQETWEDSPPGRPQTEPFAWWRLHDEYEEGGEGR